MVVGSLLVLLATHHLVGGQNKTGFPDGYDAVQAAPNTHKVIFENSLVRVLEVSLAPAGTTIPMHHHRWPSFFLSWEIGGRTPHVRYHRPDGSVRDTPSKNEPLHTGSWDVQWMAPEPMHAIEIVEAPQTTGVPSDLRIEIKCHL
jgi:hypothetical protein